MEELYETPAEYAETLKDLIENAPVGLTFVDTALRYVTADESIAALDDLPLAAHTGRKVQDVVPDLWPTLEPILRRALNGETILDVDVHADDPAPTRRKWLSSFYPVVKDGEAIGIEVKARDVTDLREAESQLESRNNLYAMLAHSNEAMLRSVSREALFERVCEIAVREGHFKFAWVGVVRDGKLDVVRQAGDDNGYFQELAEHGGIEAPDTDSSWAGDPTNKAWLSGETAVANEIAVDPASSEWHSAVRRLKIGSGASFPIRERGDLAAVLTIYATESDYFEEGLIDTLNEITPMLSIAMDRFALKEQSKEDEDDLLLRDRALRASTQGAVIVDVRTDGHPIIYATPAFEQLTGYSTDEIVGQNCRVLQGAGTDPGSIKSIRDALEAGQACSTELLNYRKNGESFWNDLTISPLFGDDGELTHFIGVQTDVTERHALELQARQLQKMDAVGQLAGGVAHDFNNILTVIRGEASLALTDETSLTSQQHIRQVDIAAQHATELTHQLLAFSRQQVLKPEPTELNSVVDETVGLVARLIGENIKLEEDFGSDLDAVLVDPGQLQQVIINLAINARDAMPDGGKISFRTSPCEVDEVYELDEPMPYAMLEITDDGCGMDANTQTRVFDPFFTTKAEGTGLGLATVYGIVRQSGGHISLFSVPNAGTTFRIYLPTTADAIAGNAIVPRALGTLDGRETILHVEDSEMIRPLIRRMLGRHGYEILSAANAKEAQEIAATHKGQIDMLLTDIVMPGLNGRELAENLHEDNPELTVLFTSGYPAETVAGQGISEDEVNFIQKPFVADDLLPLVRSLLDERTAA